MYRFLFSLLDLDAVATRGGFKVESYTKSHTESKSGH